MLSILSHLSVNTENLCKFVVLVQFKYTYVRIKMKSNSNVHSFLVQLNLYAITLSEKMTSSGVIMKAVVLLFALCTILFWNASNNDTDWSKVDTWHFYQNDPNAKNKLKCITGCDNFYISSIKCKLWAIGLAQNEFSIRIKNGNFTCEVRPTPPQDISINGLLVECNESTESEDVCILHYFITGPTKPVKSDDEVILYSKNWRLAVTLCLILSILSWLLYMEYKKTSPNKKEIQAMAISVQKGSENEKKETSRDEPRVPFSHGKNGNDREEDIFLLRHSMIQPHKSTKKGKSRGKYKKLSS